MRILLIYLECLDNEPLGLMYIGTVLRQAGFEVRLIGIDTADYTKDILKEVAGFSPDIVGVSIATPLFDRAQEVTHCIKKHFPGIMILAGGPHPTLLPEQTLKEAAVDLCIVGEGEMTAVELISRIRDKAPFEDVKGIVFFKDGQLRATAPREYIADLDILPFVDRTLVPLSVIYGRAGYPVGNPCVLIVTGRGCPYQCSFCQPTVDRMFGKQLRKRSPENVIQEIRELKDKYGIKGLWINDDTFLADVRWTTAFCDSMIENKLDMLWYANGRINNAQRGVLTKMRDAGCAGIVLTPETGSSRLRNEVLNKNISDEQILNAYRICHKVGIPVQANIMIGSPTETEDELRQSLDLIRRIQPHFMNYSYTTLLPGTSLHERYQQEADASGYYKDCRDYDFGRLKPLNTGISEHMLKKTNALIEKRYSNTSFSNRARHFFRYPYFRKIIFKRWKTLLISPHPKFRHFVFDVLAIVFGSFGYFTHLGFYQKSFIRGQSAGRHFSWQLNQWLVKLLFLFQAAFYKKTTTCPYCSSSEQEIVFRKMGIIDVCRCLNCSLLWSKPIFHFPHFYDTLYREQDMVTNIPSKKNLEILVKTHFRHTEKDYHFLIAYFKETRGVKKALDFGSSWGYFLWQMQEAGIESAGVEISDRRRSFGIAHLGVRIEKDIQTFVDRKEKFDAIFCIHSLEHLLNIGTIFNSFHQLLNKGGMLFIEVPKIELKDGKGNFESIGSIHPLGFTREFFTQNLAREGFELEVFDNYRDLIADSVNNQNTLIVVASKKQEG